MELIQRVREVVLLSLFSYANPTELRKRQSYFLPSWLRFGSKSISSNTALLSLCVSFTCRVFLTAATYIFPREITVLYAPIFCTGVEYWFIFDSDSLEVQEEELHSRRKSMLKKHISVSIFFVRSRKGWFWIIRYYWVIIRYILRYETIHRRCGKLFIYFFGKLFVFTN